MINNTLSIRIVVNLVMKFIDGCYNLVKEALIMIDISIRKKQPFVRDIICRCTRSLAMVWARRPMFNFNFERSQLRTTGSKGGSKGGMGNFHIFFTPPKNPIINTCINDDIFVLFVSHFVVSVSCRTPVLSFFSRARNSNTALRTSSPPLLVEKKK